jgi:SAM-dependent methyltransferase
MQEDWLRTNMGQSLLRQEEQLASMILDRVFGDQIVQIGAWGPGDLFLSHVRTQFGALLAANPADGVGACAAAERLPVQTDSVDAVLLPHTLELSPEPHAVLREVHRILRPDGKLIVLGFNPLSWWGMRHVFSTGGYPPGMRRQISRHRLADWLRLLNLRIDSVHGCYASVSAGRAGRLLRRWHWFASAYLMLVTKETIPMTVIRPRLTRSAGLVRGLVNPTTRNVA